MTKFLCQCGAIYEIGEAWTRWYCGTCNRLHSQEGHDGHERLIIVDTHPPRLADKPIYAWGLEQSR